MTLCFTIVLSVHDFHCNLAASWGMYVTKNKFHIKKKKTHSLACLHLYSKHVTKLTCSSTKLVTIMYAFVTHSVTLHSIPGSSLAIGIAG